MKKVIIVAVFALSITASAQPALPSLLPKVTTNKSPNKAMTEPVTHLLVSWLAAKDVDHYEVYAANNIVQAFTTYHSTTNTFVVVPNEGKAKFFVVQAHVRGYGSVRAEWDAVNSSDIVGYRVHYGVQSRQYTNDVISSSVGLVISGLTTGVTYFFAVTSVDVFGLESNYGEEVVFTVPHKKIQMKASIYTL